MIQAGGDSEAARASVEELCRRYWRPLHAYFVRCERQHPENAADLTQGFFAHFLERQVYRAADPAKGRFRSFVLVAAKHFLAHEREKAGAAKRGGGVTWIPWEELPEGEDVTARGGGGVPPEAAYDVVWAQELIGRAGRALELDFVRRGRGREFQACKRFLVSEPGPGEYAAVADALALTPGAVAVAVHRLRQRYAALVREEVAQTVGRIGDVEGELRYLAEVLNTA